MQDKHEVLATLTDERVLPSNDRMLRGIQATLQKITRVVTDQQSLAELSIIDAMLSELARRNQTRFFRTYYLDMRALLVEGLPLLKSNIDGVLAGQIESEIARDLPSEPVPEAGYEALTLLINRTLRHLAALVRAAHEGRSAPTRDFLQRVTAKENEFHVNRAQLAQSRQQLVTGEKPPLTAEKLQAYLREREPERKGLRVTNFRQLVGGFQKVTVLFETEDNSGRKESLVLRSEKDDKFVSLDASDIRNEYEIVEFVRDAGVPVAEPMWLEADASKLGNRFFVSKKIPGENFGTAVAATGITDDIVRSYVEAVAKLHKIPHSDRMRKLAVGHWLDFPTTQDNERANILYWRNQPFMKSATPSPLTERVVTWLTDNVPQGDIPLCLIHCDFGPHNTLVDKGKLSGIVDWESTRIGDPAEDVSWLLQSCGGSVDYGKAIDAYEEFTGHRISEYRLRYYDVFGCLKIMVSGGVVESMYEAFEQASVTWLNISLRFGSYGTGSLEERIRIAEAARGK